MISKTYSQIDFFKEWVCGKLEKQRDRERKRNKMWQNITNHRI